MTRIFIIHGWGGNHDTNWYPWAKVQFEIKGYQVFVPDMPNTNAPNIERWVAEIAKTVGTPDKDTYFVGHSIGCQAILRYLEKINSPIGGALFVAGWFFLENIKDIDAIKIADPWIKTPIDINKIKINLPKSILIISSNDPFGAYDKNIKEFGKFCSYIYTMQNAGHVIDTIQPSIIHHFDRLIHNNLYLG